MDRRRHDDNDNGDLDLETKLQQIKHVHQIEHDLVLNGYIAYEKYRRASAELLKSGATSVIPLSKNVAEILLCLLVLGVLLVPISFYSPLLAFYVPLFGMFLLIMYLSIQRRGLPTNLLINSDNFRFAWRTQKTHMSPTFKWDQVVSATISQIPFLKANQRSEGRCLRLRVDTDSLTLHQHWWLWTSGAKLKQDLGAPFEHNKCYFDRVVIEIPLDAFTRDSDQLLMLELVTQRLGAEKVGDSLLPVSANAPSFTQLWLDEAQSFRRESIQSLESSRALQNGRYSVLERIASGGQATVYRALDHSVEPARLVVLKELVLPVSAGSEVRKRSFDNVKNEALLLGSLSHPGIIKLIDNFIEDHRAYLVLEHVDGVTLRDIVASEGPLSEERVLPILDQLCDIFGYLHGQTPPVVHRDFSPDNLMLMNDGKVKLLDFNVALQSESTATKTVVGKHHYIAPEQFRGKPCPQSDLYSLGASIFYFRTGQDPVSLKTASLADAGLEQNVLNTLVRKLTAMDLADRFASIGELKSALPCNSKEQALG